MDLGQFLWLLRSRLWIVISAAVVGALAALLVSSRFPTLYEAGASLIAPSMASTYAEVATSRPVLEHAISSLGLEVGPEVLAESVEARPSQTSALLTITARDASPARAAEIANTIAARVVELAPTIVGPSAEGQAAIEADLATVQRQIDRTEETISALLAQSNLTPEEFQQLESQDAQLVSLLSVRASLQAVANSFLETAVTMLAPAVPPTEPSSPNILLATLVGGLAGLTIGLAIALLLTNGRVGSRRRP